MTNNKSNGNQTRLIRRYLLWCYKTTKEDLDLIDRKFTQLKVDYYILNQLFKGLNKSRVKSINDQTAISDFKKYITQKEKEAYSLKFLNKDKQALHPQYLYLRNRLEAVEASIKYFLGKRELKEIQSLYEQEMIKRILEAREHT